ncbi:MAG: iron ABC transporter permease [Marinomonas sp.]
MLTRFRPIGAASATRVRLPRSHVQGGIWSSAAYAIAALALVPLAAILWALPAGGLAAWGDISTTLLPKYVLNTGALMLITGALTALMGISTAWLVSAARFPGRGILAWALVLPLAVPAYIAAYIYADLLDFSGPVQSGLRSLFGWSAGEYNFPAIRSLPGAALVLSLVLYPYVYLLSRTAFAAQSMSQFCAARTLGLTPARAFWRVALPSARPAIAGGLALVLMETLADFGVAEYFGVPTFSTGIFRSWLAMGDKAAALKLAGVMLVFVIVLVALEASSRRGQVDAKDAIADDNALIELSGGKAALASLICALPVLLGFGLPVVILLGHAVDQAGFESVSDLWSYAADSLKLAASTSIIAAIAAVLLAYAQRQSVRRSAHAAVRLSTLGYALPGALLAVGMLAPLGGFDQSLTRFARDTFGWTGGLILAGTSIILIYALVVRFLTVAFNSVSAGMGKLPRQVDAAARSLGAGPGRVMRQIHLPQLRFSIAAGAALVFIDTLRELPATLILRPFNLETLATRVYRLASDERLAEASTAALVILAVGLIPVMMLSRASKR